MCIKLLNVEVNSKAGKIIKPASFEKFTIYLLWFVSRYPFKIS